MCRVKGKNNPPAEIEFKARTLRRKRRKIDLKGTFQQFLEMQEEQKREETEAEAAAASQVQADQNDPINDN